ncbi:MAG: NAD(P)-binding protein [Myxococcales bacterium]|nr:NAD(P)-binding protein [Myxococcales bacterium]
MRKQQRDRLERYARELATSGDADLLLQIAELAGLAEEGFRAAMQAGTEARGTLDARVVTLSLPRRDVELLLPAGLQLAPQPLTMPDRHPVFLLFSHEHFDAWFDDMDYHELLLGVPWVELTEQHLPHRGPFIYMPRLYLDQALPRVLGNHIYGFEKLAADIDVTDDAYSVREPEGGTLLIEGRFTATGEPVAPGALPHFDAVQQMLEQPTISQALRIVDPHAFHRRTPGPFLACTNRYRFDDPSARITPLQATVRITGDFSPPGLPTGTYDRGSLASERLGAFHVRVPQEISLPGSSQDVRYPVTPPASGRRKKIVVLGGGPASCAAAFYLAKTGLYDITLYTLGFRLGGKCAAGRNPNAALRIEEHGLHAFIGFYNNALRTVREVYEQAELPLARGRAPWTVEDLARGDGPVAEAFVGTNAVGLMGRWRDQQGRYHWRYFPTTTELNDAVPGVVPHDEDDGPQGFARAMKITIERAVKHARVLRKWDDARRQSPSRANEPDEHDFLDRLLDRLEARFERTVRLEEWALFRFLERMLAYFEKFTYEEISRAIEANTTTIRAVCRILRRLRRMARRSFASEIHVDPDRWFEWSGLDIMLTIAIGVLTERVIHFDQLDGIDLCQWLRLHGVAPGNDRSPIVMSVYDTLFANGSSEPVRPDDLAAGVGLRWFLLLLDYRGFQAYEFRYSCPQTLFTPYYKALRKLGVEFRFFHRVDQLRVERDGDERTLVGIRLRKQATVKAGPGAYEPLWLPPIPDNPPHLPPWPDRPDYEQLQEGTRLHEHDLEDAWSAWPGVEDVELRQGEDFDLCVCGMSLGAIPSVVEDLVDRRSPAYCEPWARMIHGMETCQTISMQLWMERPEAQLYALPDRPEVPPHRGLLTEYAAPEPSFGNLSHLIEHEGWRQDPRIETPPAFLAYHTGALTSGHPLHGHPFDDHDYPDRVRADWRRRAKNWLRHNYRDFYDRAPAQWDAFCEQLVAPKDVRGEDRLWWQFFNVGLQPWDLYVLSQPGRISLRLGQSESWVRGLFLCGDWTRTDINAGCVEAATQSGMLCARVISNHPRYVWHPGF